MRSLPWFVDSSPFGARPARFHAFLSKSVALFADFAALAILLVATWNVGSAQQPLQALHSHVHPEVSTREAALVGSMSYDQQMNLSIVLPLRNQAELSRLLSRLYDPSSPDYRRFLSVAEFTERFAPTVADYQAVVSFAQSNGFTITDTPANRLIVPVSGSVDQINKAF
ncbi:MAG TPA: protease pro-enzyme activation domain-containing protein, partial [Acidobacteriaceae bacterium]